MKKQITTPEPVGTHTDNLGAAPINTIQWRAAELPTTDVAAVWFHMQDRAPSWIQHLPLAGYQLNDESKQRMAQDMAPAVARYVRGMGMSQSEAVALAFKQVFGLASDMDFIDGTYVSPMPGAFGSGLFVTVAGRVGRLSQLSGDYQHAVLNVIHGATAAAISFGSLGSKQFEPDSYKSMNGIPLPGGSVILTRIPKDASTGMRTVSVTITADQVVTELDAIRRKNSSRPDGVAP